jgi:hypothetical protein
MEDNTKLLESLLDKAKEYGITSFELAKLKALEKSTDIVSSLVPGSIVFVLIASFLIFLSLGVAFLIGDLLGKVYLGFLIVAGFYLLVALIIRLFLYNWIKKVVGDSMIKHILK